ncbi:MAG TPA: hypothetical protein VNZ49_10490 [Bacteroidia bacterium]|jgi:hypothetical protein|nr:hypothetical protein [Bacteroidia bacterium]
MKPLLVFYSICIVALYSVFAFIGYRQKQNGSNAMSRGFLTEITVSTSVCKTAKSRLLAEHFDNALAYLGTNQKNKSAEQIYDALMVFTVGAISSGNYDQKGFWEIIKNLSDSYIDLQLNRPVNRAKLRKVFESTELFIAEEFMLKSSYDLNKNSFLTAIEDVNKAEVSIMLASKYSGRLDKEQQKEILNNSVTLLKDIIKENDSRKISASWKRMMHKMNNLEGAA